MQRIQICLSEDASKVGRTAAALLLQNICTTELPVENIWVGLGCGWLAAAPANLDCLLSPLAAAICICSLATTSDQRHEFSSTGVMAAVSNKLRKVRDSELTFPKSNPCLSDKFNDQLDSTNNNSSISALLQPLVQISSHRSHRHLQSINITLNTNLNINVTKCLQKVRLVAVNTTFQTSMSLQIFCLSSLTSTSRTDGHYAMNRQIMRVAVFWEDEVKLAAAR